MAFRQFERTSLQLAWEPCLAVYVRRWHMPTP